MRWRDGAAARAYIEHLYHVLDLRDVPVKGLVEAGGVLPCAERDGRGMLRPCVVVQRRRAAGKAAGSRVRWRNGAAARAYREHAEHARDLRDVPVQGLVEAGEVRCHVWQRGGRGMLIATRGVQRRRAPGKAGGSRAVARWGSGPGVHRTCGTCS